MTQTRYLRRFLVRPALVLMLVVLSTPALPPAGGAAAVQPVTLRVGVTRDGIVQVTAADLIAAGVDMGLLAGNPEAVAMSSLGQPVASRVITDALTGQFKSLQFFGQRFRSQDPVHPEMEEKYTDERAYWLEIGAAPGLRLPEVNAAPDPGNPLTPPNDFLTTVRAEESLLWWTLTPNPLAPEMDRRDTWFWGLLRTGTSSDTLPFPSTIPHPAPGSAATLRLEEIAQDHNPLVDPDHRTVIAVNGSPLLDEYWDGKARKVFTANIPAGILTDGPNTVAVSALIPPGITVPGARVFVNYWEIDYRRLFRAANGQLDFTAEGNGPHEYLTAGWGAGQVEAWDITNPNEPKRLVGFAKPAGAEDSLRFRAGDAAGARYWLQSADSVAAPASLRLRSTTDLRQPDQGGADAVIVTAGSLSPAAVRLAQWHAAHGRLALVADFQDICDEFNDGIYNPKAVPLMLAWAKEHWAPAPAYLTLIGDGHWNFKGFNPGLYPPEPNLIPPYLAWVDPWQGEVPADPLYGDYDFDGMPDLAVGRLAVNSLDEANMVVDKIAAYGEEYRVLSWQQEALFIADRKAAEGDYPTLSEEIITKYLPSDMLPQRIYLGITVPDGASAKAAIFNAITSGALMVQYSGHGDANRWSRESIWLTTDVYGLQNGARLPVVMTFNCKDGYFAYPGIVSIAESMQRQPNGGSIAAVSPSGLGETGSQHLIREKLMQTIFQDDVREVGKALLIAKQRYLDAGGPYYQVATLMFYGDPAMRLPGPARKVYVPFVLGSR